MDYMPEHSILKFYPDTFEVVRKAIGLDKVSDMEKAIDIFENWIQKQEHFLKKTFPKIRNENLIVIAKGSIEQAKKKLDALCTFRTLMPKYFGDFDIRKDFEELNSHCYSVILPVMTKEHHRVILLKMFGTNYGQNFLTDVIRQAAMFAEYLLLNDYNNGLVVVIDYTDADLMELLSVLPLSQVREGTSILLECFSARIKGMHLLTPSKLIESIVFLCKQVLNAKMANRVFTHKDIDSLHKMVEKDVLPVEYKGKEKSVKVLNDEWHNALSSEKFRNHQAEMTKARTDETLRNKEEFINEYLGLPGTFRSLNVD